MRDLRLRRAESTDAGALAAIGAATFAEAFGELYPPDDLAAFIAANHTPEHAARVLADPRQATWLLQSDGETVGYALVSPCALPHPDVTPACAELKRIYVLAKWRGGGAGARLLDAALAWAERDGPRRVWLSVYQHNHAAQRFYERHGFERVGEYFFAVGASRDPEFIYRRG